MEINQRLSRNKKLISREVLYLIGVLISSIFLSFYIEKYKNNLEKDINNLIHKIKISRANYFDSKSANLSKYKLYKTLIEKSLYAGSFEFFDNQYNNYRSAQDLYYKLGRSKIMKDSISEKEFIEKFFKRELVLEILEKITYDYNMEAFGDRFELNHNKLKIEDYYYRLLNSDQEFKACYERTVKLRGMTRKFGYSHFKNLLSYDNPISFEKIFEFEKTNQYKKLNFELEQLKTENKYLNIVPNNYILALLFMFLVFFGLRYILNLIIWSLANLNSSNT